MKKFIFCFLVFILVSFFTYIVNAYSTEDYSINIPSTYNKVTEGSFTKSNGNNVNVQITRFSGDSSNAFSDDELEKFVKNINSEIDNLRDEMKKQMKEKYGDYLLDSEINEYVKSFKCNSIEKKEITVATKNNYKCYHIIANYSMGDYNYYCEQYSFISNNAVYTLTVSVGEKSELHSSEIKDIINSFTINNYKEPSAINNFFSSDLFAKMLAATIFAVISVAIGYFKNKNSNESIIEDKQKNDDISKENKNGNISSNKVNNSNLNVETIKEKRYCTKCGEEINQNWDFCNNCGNKLR